MKIGFIGAGQMATALSSGIATSQPGTEFFAFDPNPQAMDDFAKQILTAGSQFTACDSNQQVADASEYVFLAVKPHFADAAMDSITVSVDDSTLFISIVAGLSSQRLNRWLDARQIVRVMPNTPSLIGEGALALSCSEAVDRRRVEIVKTMLEKIGFVAEVPENMMDAVTGLSGSGPAFVFTFVESLIDAGVRVGIPRALSKQLALQTVFGSVKLLQQSETHPAMLRDQVTSPGGTTIHGMEQLEANGFRNSVLAAVVAATGRSRDLA